jgi:hypothetical protein
MIGIEPTWIAPLDPKSSASASFATSAEFPHQNQIGGAKIGKLHIKASHKRILICEIFGDELFATIELRCVTHLYVLFFIQQLMQAAFIFSYYL